MPAAWRSAPCLLHWQAGCDAWRSGCLAAGGCSALAGMRALHMICPVQGARGHHDVGGSLHDAPRSPQRASAVAGSVSAITAQGERRARSEKRATDAAGKPGHSGRCNVRQDGKAFRHGAVRSQNTPGRRVAGTELGAWQESQVGCWVALGTRARRVGVENLDGLPPPRRLLVEGQACGRWWTRGIDSREVPEGAGAIVRERI